MRPGVEGLRDVLRDRAARGADELLAEAALACPDVEGAWEAITEWYASEMLGSGGDGQG